MSHLKLIIDLVEASARSLEKGLHAYWPVVFPENNGLQEANLTTHMASEALSRGFFAYPEASNANTSSGHSRVDLMLLRGTGQPKLAILVEAKKLYSSEKAGEMLSDFEKISRFQFVDDSRHVRIESQMTKYGVLLAITTSAANRAWWDQPYEWDSGASWDRLKAVLEQASYRSSIEFNVCDRPQYILYAVFELPTIQPLIADCGTSGSQALDLAANITASQP